MDWLRQQRLVWTVLAAILSATAAAGEARADTIVLKNGRRIAAQNVIENGDKVQYETASGTLMLPRSIVDHIERGGAALVEGSASRAELNMKPPETTAAEPLLSSNGGEIRLRVVRNGEVDRSYVADLETQAHSGVAVATQNAALVHHLASQFELQHGDMDLALADARTALIYMPEQPVLLMDMAYLHLRRSEFTQSLQYIERARRLLPEDPEVSKLAGWAYYSLNKMDQAVAEWKHAESLRPDAEIEAALKKAQRDKEEEERYKENESYHFTLRYSGASEPSLARDVLRTLEHHFSAIDSELNYSPPDSIGVILYTQQAFADITRAPNWVGALNDGRIRVPVQGLTSVTPDLSRVLKHELTHSFVQQKTVGRAPAWIQEGLAQWLEGKRSEGNAAGLVRMYQRDPSLGEIHFENGWMKLSSEDATAAYAWALANIEYIVNTGGMSDVNRILDHLAAGEADEDAVRAALRLDLKGLAHDTVEYLKKAY